MEEEPEPPGEGHVGRLVAARRFGKFMVVVDDDIDVRDSRWSGPWPGVSSRSATCISRLAWCRWAWTPRSQPPESGGDPAPPGQLESRDRRHPQGRLPGRRRASTRARCPRPRRLGRLRHYPPPAFPHLAEQHADVSAPVLEVVGHSVPRIDGRRKVTGAAVYVNDLVVPGMLHGKLLRSPYPHARIRSIDTARAEALPGVRAVVTGRRVVTGLWGSQIKDQPTLPADRVRYAGEPVAAVAADTEEIAARACGLIDVAYEELPFVEDVVDALAPGAVLLHADASQYEHRDAVCRPQVGTNVLNHTRVRKGDVDAGLALADVVVDHTYTTQAQAHVALEPHGSLAAWDGDGRVSVWTSTQAPFLVRNDLARALCMPPSRVRVIGTDVGGGFGGKVHIRLEAYAALLARASRRPVRIIHTRRGDVRQHHPPPLAHPFAYWGHARRPDRRRPHQRRTSTPAPTATRARW